MYVDGINTDDGNIFARKSNLFFNVDKVSFGLEPSIKSQFLETQKNIDIPEL